MRFKYLGGCAKGFVKFSRPDGSVTMREGEAVEVPAWLAQKLKTNNHFEAVADAEQSAPQAQPDEAPKRRGRKPKAVTDDASGA